MTTRIEVFGVKLNPWLDRLPRSTVTVAHRQLPAFRSMGVIGAQVGLAVGWLAAVRAGFSLTAVAAMLVVVAATFFGWGVVRRAVTGDESTVLLEHVWLALGGEAIFLWLADLPVLVGLDVFSIGLAVFLAFGRLGCLVAGCCHGTPAPTGIRYGVDHQHDAVPARLVGQRLRPVQLIEAVGLAVIALIGWTIVGATPGLTVTWFLASYALLRFGTESLRGDARPHIGPVSVPRIMVVVQAFATGIGYEAWVVPGPAGRPFWSSIGLLVIALIAGLALAVARRPSPLVAPAHLDESWSEILALGSRAAVDSTKQTVVAQAAVAAQDPLCSTTHADMVIVVSRSIEGLHVSLSHPEHDVEPVAVALGATSPVVVRGVVHFDRRTPHGPASMHDSIDLEPTTSRTEDSYFGPISPSPKLGT